MKIENNAQSDSFPLDERLQSLNNADLYELVHTLLDKKPDLNLLVLEWFKEKQEKSHKTRTDQDIIQLDDDLLFEYWENARGIISEFNVYGGGDRDDEDEAYGYLDDISELIKEGKISSSAKLDFLEDAFEEYNHGNSGFEDKLMDIFFAICQTNEEWEYLVKKFDEYPSSWRKTLIMDIQKNYLCNDEAYMEERIKNLHYGLDYWDLVTFYTDRGDLQKALETAQNGIQKGEGRLTELFNFLSDHFTEKQDTSNMERIVQISLSRKTEEKNMLDRLFDYYKSLKDYEKAKEALLRSYEFIGWDNSYYTEYKKMKEFFKDSDWKKIENRIFYEIKEKDLYDYLRICLDKNMKKTVLNTILNQKPPRGKLGLDMEDGFNEFADILETDYPEGIIEYYWQKAYNKIPGGNRKTYMGAVRYLEKVKYIYTDILQEEPLWIARFSKLKSEFNNRPAFLDEAKQLE